MYYYTHYCAPFGILCLVSDQQGLRQLWLPNKVETASLPVHWKETADSSRHCQIIQRLDHYFAGYPTVFTDLPLYPEGTAFQQKVWQQLQTLTYGRCSHYAAIAAALNHPKAARAIGNAIGKNPIPILIPCHRVLGKERQLTGYAGGLTIKKALLALEHISHH